MKQLAFILVLALLICACGCQPSSLSNGGISTKPSNTDPSVSDALPTDKTEPSATVDLPSVEPDESTPAAEVETLEYVVLEEDDRVFGEPDFDQYVVLIIRSAEDCEDWLLELLDTRIENYGEGYFNDHSIVMICSTTGSIANRYRIADVSETDNGYLFSLEYCMPEGGADMCWYGSVVVAVDRVIPEDAVIQVESTTVHMTNDEYEAYFGDTGC